MTWHDLVTIPIGIASAIAVAAVGVGGYLLNALKNSKEKD